MCSAMAVLIGLLAIILYTVAGVPLDNMYPYPLSNITAGPDDKLMPPTLDGSSHAINFSFTFFNMSFDTIYVNNNGHLSFIGPVSLFTPQPFPLPKTSLIAPFWMDVDTRNTGLVWYKLTNDSELLKRAQADVLTHFPHQNTFQPTDVLTATWVDVPYWVSTGYELTKEVFIPLFSLTPNVLGISNCVFITSTCKNGAVDDVISLHLSKEDFISVKRRNTFQVALVTDGETSFAMFHYHKIEWAGYDDNVTKAEVGFNAGDGVNSYTVNNSDQNDVINLVNRSNTGMAGKFIFRVDGDAIIEPAGVDISIGICTESRSAIHLQRNTLTEPDLIRRVLVMFSFESLESNRYEQSTSKCRVRQNKWT